MKRLLAFVWLVTAAPVPADEVLLRGGGRMTGVVVERTEARVVIETAPGRVTLPAWRVERVVSGASDLADFEERASRLSALDVDGWLALGQWARERGLQTRARAAFERVLEADPGNEAANAALDHVLHRGRWMTLHESYAASGLVEFEGAWLTPAERAAAERARTEALLAERALAEAQARAREAEARALAAEAEARRAEADAQAGYTGAAGIPLWWAYSSGGYGAWATPYGHAYTARAPRHRGRDGDHAARTGDAAHPPRPARPSSIGPTSGTTPRSGTHRRSTSLR
jgi:hypothetical protein